MRNWLSRLFSGASSQKVQEADAAGDDNKESVTSRMPNEFEELLRPRTLDSAWIGVGLDGTLSIAPEHFRVDHINPPVPEMLKRVKDWIAHGYTVKVVTARASIEGGAEVVKKWLVKNGLPDVEVTNAKDFHMLEMWDDRGVQVLMNSGTPVGPSMIEHMLAEKEKEEQEKATTSSEGEIDEG